MYHLLGTLIISLSIQTESRVILTPSGEIFVCPGGQLSFRCSTNLRFLEWNIIFSKSDSASRKQLVTPVTELELDLIIHELIFNITRSSAYDSLPLISTLTIATAVADLNATKINCTEIKTSDDKNSSFATINIINTYPDPPPVRAPEPLEFRTNSILVLIDWEKSRLHENDTAYYVDAIPQALVIFSSSTSVQLQVLYNNVYNVSITATLCGQRNATTTVLLSFAKCIHPRSLPMIDDSLSALLDNDPALFGTNATFSCLPGQVFSGPYKSTCTENGDWDPDPHEVECIVDCGPPSLPPSGYIFPYTSTIDGAVVNFACERSILNQDENLTIVAAICDKQGKWDPNPAEFCTEASESGINQGALIGVVVTLFIAAVIIALLLIIIGGWFHQNRKRKFKKRKKPRPRRPTPPPKELYYNLRPSFEQDNSMELTGQMQPNRPIVMYDDIISSSKRDSNRPVIMYDDILSPNEQSLKAQNTKKPKVMYDELIPPCEQEDPVDLKRNTAYRPADSK